MKQAYGLDKASGNGSRGGGAAKEGVQNSKAIEEVVVVMPVCVQIRSEASAKRGDASTGPCWTRLYIMTIWQFHARSTNEKQACIVQNGISTKACMQETSNSIPDYKPELAPLVLIPSSSSLDRRDHSHEFACFFSERKRR